MSAPRFDMAVGVALLLLLPGLASASHHTEWTRLHSCTPGSHDVGQCIQRTPDGGFVLVGITRDAGSTDDDLWIVKTTATGELLWSHRYGGAGRDEGLYVDVTPDGGYVVTGATSSWGAGALDVWLLRLDADGLELWSRTYGFGGDDRANGVVALDDGGFAVIATTFRNYSIWDDTWLLRLDAAGDVVWSHMWDYESNDDRGHSVQETSDGGFIVGGHSYAWSGSDLVATLLRYTSDGTLLWAHAYGGGDDERGSVVRQCADGGFALTGYTRSIGAGGDDIYLLKTDADGVVEWERGYGDTGNETGSFLSVLDDGGYLLTGTSDSFGTGDTDAYVVRTDAAGDVVWTRTLGGPDDDRGHGHVVTPAGDLVVAGAVGLDADEGADFAHDCLDANGDLQWERQHGCTPTSDDVGISVQRTADGGFVTVGYTRDVGGADDDLWLVRTDAAGAELWSRRYGGPGDDQGWYVALTADGGFIVTGRTSSSGAGALDLWLLRLDAAGDEVWSRTYGSSGDDVGMAVTPVADGFVVVGTSHRDWILYDDVWLLHTDAAGDVVWSTMWDFDTNSDRGHSVQQTTDGGFIVGGHSYARNLDGFVDLVATLIRYDAGGNVVWYRTYGDDYREDRGSVVRQCPDGGFVFTGFTRSSTWGLDEQVFLVRTDPAGDVVWYRDYGGTGTERGSSVSLLDDGGFLVTGHTDSEGAGGFDVYLVRTDENGNRLWTGAIGSPGDDYGEGQVDGATGGIVVAGSYAAGDGSRDLLLFEEREDVLGVPGAGLPIAGMLRVGLPMPNPTPAGTALAFELQRAGHVRVDVFDVAGRTVLTLLDERLAPGPHQVQWTGRDRYGRTVPSGTYYCRVRTGDEERSRVLSRLP